MADLVRTVFPGTSQRCRDKLDTLAVSVMMQWPGVKLRVIESWDEYSHHKKGSLHYEGRAVDITTDDRHQSKYGMLARLAVEAGFDWVYYESKRHVHCSVKPDSVNERKPAGCFERSSLVQTREGPRPMSAVRINDEVLSYNSDKGTLEYSPVITFLDRDPTRKEHFVKIKTESGEQLVLTRYHLVYRQEYDGQPSVTYAVRILPGDKILTLQSDNVTHGASFSGDMPLGQIRATKVLAVHHVRSRGVYAPLTATGNIVVNGVVASCYALVNDHQLAHKAFAPLRMLYRPLRWLRWWLSWLRGVVQVAQLLHHKQQSDRAEQNKRQKQQQQQQQEQQQNSRGQQDTLSPSQRPHRPGKLTEALLSNSGLTAKAGQKPVTDAKPLSSPDHGDEMAEGGVEVSNEEELDDPVDAYTASFRGVHWYAALLYNVFQSILASYMP